MRKKRVPFLPNTRNLKQKFTNWNSFISTRIRIITSTRSRVFVIFRIRNSVISDILWFLCVLTYQRDCICLQIQSRYRFETGVRGFTTSQPPKMTHPLDHTVQTFVKSSKKKIPLLHRVSHILCDTSKYVPIFDD